jgi:formamidopyrimidine-DNA glycosylase
MPELPEVETIKRELEKKVINTRILAVRINNRKVIREPSLVEFRKRLTGASVKEIIRRAKVLIFRLDNGSFLIVHLRIAGWLLCGAEDKKARVVFRLSNGKCLNYMDQRLLGELRLRKDFRDLKFIKSLGPEPFEINLSQFGKIIKSRKTKIKALLMDQSLISGIGNIYAQEALFLSRIDPRRASSSLTNAEIKLLHKNIIGVLKEAIAHKGSSVDSYRDLEGNKGGMEERLKVYGRQGEPCFVCKKPLDKLSLAGRGTCFCSRCQR